MHPSPWPVRVHDLLLRDPVEADTEALLAFRNDPDVNRFMVHTHVDPDDLRRDLRGLADSATDHTCVVERDGGVVAIGFLEVVDGPGQPGAPTGTDGLIGYVVDPRHARQGIGRATAHELLRACFERLGLRRVSAAAYADNPASVRILEAVGMRRERLSRQALWHAELGWIDEVGYAVLAEEWAARPA
ncbi:GNAT family N-acetyltransferase [Nocardioides okcheonensis]|uniref:GNAT family N-acetyltransferase n=1 Tax=Nocardioides okcheonensis TaxID=2894081 RepID=UPI001E5F2993|nr:GNAT family protein [Nocardioides okcheonensis]UFN43068.1 GNAT family N-acetyltransferase [Nocardioides okcheonensis]